MANRNHGSLRGIANCGVKAADLRLLYHLRWSGDIARCLAPLASKVDPTYRQAMRSRLALQVKTVDTMVEPAETRLLVDGEDLIATWLPHGGGVDPDVLLGPDGGLRAADQPHRVTIGRPECDPGCCGSLEVRVRRDGDDVVWDQWFTPRVDAPTGEIRFSARDYTGELERADREREWEWTGRTVVRLARQMIAADPVLLARFGDRRPEYLIPWPVRGADAISVSIPAPPHWRFDPPDPRVVTFRFDDRAPSAQASDLLAAIASAAETSFGQ